MMWEEGVKEIFIFGAGGHGKEIHQILDDMAEDGASVRCAGFIVDEGVSAPDTVRGTRVYKGMSEFRRAQTSSLMVVIALGSGTARRHVFSRLSAEFNVTYPTLVHPSAIVGRNVVLGEGVVVFPRVVLMTDIVIGDHSHFNVGATVSHDCVIGEFASVHPGAVVTGACRLEDGCEIGANAVLRPKVTVGAGAVVAAGAAVVSDVPSRATVMGVPARSKAT